MNNQILSTEERERTEIEIPLTDFNDTIVNIAMKPPSILLSSCSFLSVGKLQKICLNECFAQLIYATAVNSTVMANDAFRTAEEIKLSYS